MNNEIKNVSVKILNLWLSDFGDIRCNALISINGKDKANVIASFDRENYQDWKNCQNEYKEEINDMVDQYLHLPKISKCSKLLQEIYDNVCSSDATMCHVDLNDWNEDYSDRYTEKDFQRLKDEVKELNLDDVITFDDGEYKIVGWGNLETSFNDDRHLQKNKDKEER